MKRGLVIGKFYPPHSGHAYLINQALAGCDELDVLIVDNPDYKIDVSIRKRWLEETHPAANVRVIQDIYDDDNSAAWAEHTLKFLGYAPDIVFSSEEYGITWSRLMGAEHCLVDHDRRHVPVSGTRVRANMLAEWRHLEPAIRKDLAIRIVVLGAESTGTTTLSKGLAQHYKAPWVPEFGRHYTEALQYSNRSWTDEDFRYIAKAQQEWEQELAITSSGLIICDTNATATVEWQKRYMGHTTAEVTDIAAKDIVDHYFITGDEIPFVQDGLRDGEHIRYQMHKDFIKRVKATGRPYTVLRGNKTDRLENAIRITNAVIHNYRVGGNRQAATLTAMPTPSNSATTPKNIPA